MPLRWYVIHAYSNFENKVKRSLEERVKRDGLEHKFGKIIVPTEEVVEEVKEAKAEAAPKTPNKPKDTRPARRARSRATSGVQIEGRKKRRSEPETYMVEDALRHPTIFPTNEDLQAEYGFVLRDLRNMFLLAAVLMVALVVMASLI